MKSIDQRHVPSFRDDEQFQTVLKFNAIHANARRSIETGKITAESIRNDLASAPIDNRLMEDAANRADVWTLCCAAMRKMNSDNVDNYAAFWALALCYSCAVWVVESSEMVSVDVRIDGAWMIFSVVDLDGATTSARVKWREWLRMNTPNTIAAYEQVLFQVLKPRHENSASVH